MDMCGAALALSQAPVSVVQPIADCGLAILCVFSHFYLKEVMNGLNWVAITLADLGTIGVGVGGEEQKVDKIPLFNIPWLVLSIVILFEAFRSVEDIHGLMSMVKRTPKPSVLVVYYAKLTEIFWISDSHLYHAYAWRKLFNLQKSYNKNLSQKDLQLIASSVLLAALSMAPYGHKYAGGSKKADQRVGGRGDQRPHHRGH